jgi:hypothetical protein
VTKARPAGISWTVFAGRYCRRAKALAIALPLLLLSVLVDHGLAGASMPDAGRMAGARQASHLAATAGTEGKAQLPGRQVAAFADGIRYKIKLPTDGAHHPAALPAAQPALPGAVWRQGGKASAAGGRVAALRLSADPRGPPARA